MSRHVDKCKVKVTFDDVAGIEDAKEELVELVDFLKKPEKYTKIGARIPRGVLCAGPPGTGKTLIAKAVSGEADCVFISVSASEFVEVFAGMGASKIRKVFDEARKSAPCIIFIDEIDAIGKKRSSGEFMGSHDEREQTLNQLLVEMDGFVGNEGVIVIAATNRHDVLDRALLRPGRFDRKVVLELPDVKGREAILKVHSKNIVCEDNLKLNVLAKTTRGASGADLANILNEAALLAARRGADKVNYSDCVYARDKVIYGKERKNKILTDEIKKSVAFHEAGHAAVSFFQTKSSEVEKVTIIPRGVSLGATYFVPKDETYGYTKTEIEQELAVLMGGRCAEELFLDDISSGAMGDIETATMLARNYVARFGMSDLGPVNYAGSSEGLSALANPFSEHTKEQIDKAVRALITNAQNVASEILKTNAKKVTKLAETLKEQETLDFEVVKKILSPTRKKSASS